MGLGRMIAADYKPVPFQKAAATAIRNVVSRSRDLAAEFLAADAESLLRAALATHPKVQSFSKIQMCNFRSVSYIRIR